MALKTFERNQNAIIAERDKNKSGNRYYSFKQGKTVIRILPPYSERGVWFRSISEYYFKLGDQDVFLTSPRDSGGRDPIAEHVNRLYKSGDEKLVEQAKEFRPRKRFLVNAVVLSDPAGTGLKDGVKVIALPVKVKEELVKYDTDVDEGYGDITNLETGRNVTIEKTGDGLSTRYSVRAQVKTTNVFEVAGELGVDPNSWSLTDLDSIVKPSSFEELNNALQRKTAELTQVPLKREQATIPVNGPVVNATTTVVGNMPMMVPVTGAPVPVPDVPAPWEE